MKESVNIGVSNESSVQTSCPRLLPYYLKTITGYRIERKYLFTGLPQNLKVTYIFTSLDYDTTYVIHNP